MTKKLFETVPKKIIKLNYINLFLIFMIFMTVFVSSIDIRFAMIWNIFLASLPLVMAAIILNLYKNNSSKFIIVLFSLAWLFIFPNSPYVVTDLIHISRYNLNYPIISEWLGLTHLFIVVIVGLYLGMLSLYIMQMIVKDMSNKKIANAFVVTVSLLSGVAIYIGRFMRFNTWDIVTRPFYLLMNIVYEINITSILLSLLFAFITLVVYLMFYYYVDDSDV